MDGFGGSKKALDQETFIEVRLDQSFKTGTELDRWTIGRTDQGQREHEG